MRSQDRIRAAVAALRHACHIAELLMATEPEAARQVLVSAARGVVALILRAK